jgi:peptidoglycan/xylan/chitin deacetylase (PgdA/CDA1 family)
MNAQHLKQLLKNGAYRALGETSTALGADGDAGRALRVLMYHKINDTPDNPTTVPVAVFDQQMGQLGRLGYTVVGLDAVIDYYRHGTPLPERAVLITFDDGYIDILANAQPVLERHGYPAVLFAPVAYMETGMPLPHERLLALEGVRNPTMSWEQLLELDRRGTRVESHGIGHRPLVDLELDEALREITVSKLKLEERLGRPVQAFAYVKGSEFHFRGVHVSLVDQAGYDVAFSAVSGSNGPDANPLRLQRYNVEPYPPRTFELVLSGACDLIALKDTVAGTHARRLFNQALGTASQ